MSGSLLIPMDDAKFADIPNKAIPRTVRLNDPTLASPKATNWMLIGYSEKLIRKNEKLQHFLEQYAGRRDDPDCWNQLTPGQRILYALTALDGQVRNGGVTQFFWNCSDLIFPAGDALAALGYVELSAAYEQALERLLGQKDRWMDLRDQSRANPDDFWGSFQKTYDLLELDWFDNAYFKQFGPALVTMLVKYVSEHKAEFIEQ